MTRCVTDITRNTVRLCKSDGCHRLTYNDQAGFFGIMECSLSSDVVFARLDACRHHRRLQRRDANQCGDNL